MEGMIVIMVMSLKHFYYSPVSSYGVFSTNTGIFALCYKRSSKMVTDFLKFLKIILF